MTQHGKPAVVTWLFVTCGAWLIVLGLYFILLRPPLLPEDAAYMGLPAAQIRIAVPALESWLRHVFTVMGGFMTSTGVLTVFFATRVMPIQTRGASWAIALAGASSVALMSATNFALSSAFRWVLLAPAVLWFAGIIMYARNGSRQRNGVSA